MSERAVCWRRMSERIGTLNNLETLVIDGIPDADAALQHLAALSKLSRLSIVGAKDISKSALAKLTALTALIVSHVQFWVGGCTSLLHAQHKAGMLHQFAILLKIYRSTYIYIYSYSAI